MIIITLLVTVYNHSYKHYFYILTFIIYHHYLLEYI